MNKLKQELKDYLVQYGRNGLLVDIYNKFPYAGHELTNKQKGDRVRTVWRKLDTKVESEAINKAKILVFDLETSPLSAYVWSLWKQNVNPTNGMLLSQKMILSWSAKWLYDSVIMHDYMKPKEIMVEDDSRVTHSLYRLIDEADVIIAHNAIGFDVKIMNTRFMLHGLNPPSHYQVIDTLLHARKRFKLESNKLDYLGQVLSLGNKKSTGGFQLWARCMKGSKKAMKKMVSYCITPDQKLLGKDLIWKAAEEFKEGDIILGFDEEPDKNSRQRKYKNSIITKITYDTQPVFEVVLSNGDKLKVTGEHKFLCRSGHGYQWLETNQLRTLINKDGSYGTLATKLPKLLNVWEEDKSYEAGYISGILDGEGTYYSQRNRLSFSQRPTMVLDKCLSILNGKWGYGNYDNWVSGNDCRVININGPVTERLRFLGTYRAERLIDKVNFDNLGRIESRIEDALVMEINELGEQEIIKISTSTKTFICEGYPMHNCDRDVELLEAVYLRLRPWIKPHPNVNVIIPNTKVHCPVCSSQDISTNGTYTTYANVYEAKKCNTCHSTFRSRSAVKIDKKNLFIPTPN